MSKCGNCYYGVMTGPNKMFCSAQNCFCEEVFYCEDYEPIVKSITNADHIRMMSDDELDKFLGDIQWDVANYCGGVTQNQTYPIPEQRGAWLDWLKGEWKE